MWRRLLKQWPLLVLVALYAASVLLFSTSMLSTSTVMRTIATEACPDTVAAPVDQVVLILIDAMRPDFVLSRLRPFARTGGACDVHGDVSLSTIWAENRYTGPTLHYMESSLQSATDASLAFFLVADAPTTTAQRIKAIATGTMPAFLEAGSNFNSEAIELDSIVGQMNGSAVLLGDDTWEKLFPNTPAKRHWKHAVGIPSFDVADFHTNDDAVLKEIYDVLRRETPEAVAAAAEENRTVTAGSSKAEGEAEPHAGLVVAHFLGIDHVGHRIDADNPFMKGKILQLDEMLRNVSQQLRERPTRMNTMLLVMGDHGMTNSGDHGGGSAQETDTFLFAQYFPGALSSGRAASTSSPNHNKTSNSNLAGTSEAAAAVNARYARQLMRRRWHDRVDAEFDRLLSCRDAAGVAHDRLGATYQVDVTSTIAVLLGRPIPYSSFGRAIPEVLALANASTDIAAVERCNLKQLERYFRESAMKIPRDAAWLPPRNVSVTQQLADMSYFARRTRTDMHRAGMFVGSTGLLVTAMSLLWSPVVRAYLTPGRGGWMMRWTVLVLVLRLCSVFSNSFVVNEDTEVVGLLSSLLLSLCVPRVLAAVAMTRGSAVQTRDVNFMKRRGSVSVWSRCVDIATALQQTGELFVGLLLFALRLAMPVLLRYRAHITHTVETESAADRLIAAHPFLQVERLGVVAAGALWAVLYAPERPVPLQLVGCTTACVACVYHIPVAHHLVPLLCVVFYPYVHCCWVRISPRVSAAAAVRRRACHRSYGYFVLTLWLSSLCNGKVAAAVVIAVYSVVLPRLCNAVRREPLLTQATVLHLFAFVGFFAAGHQCMLNTIDWNASFVGMPFYNMYAGGVLVLSRTFHAFALVPLALFVAPHVQQSNGPRALILEEMHVAKAKKDDAESTGSESPTQNVSSWEAKRALSSASLAQPATTGVEVVVVVVVYVYLLLIQSAISCFNGYIQKTHLMLFPIFCPKLLFDAVIALLTSAVALLCIAMFGPV